MKFLGSGGFFDNSYLNIVGIYGYSFSSFLITCLFCAIPITPLQWVLIAYSVVASTFFLGHTYWQDLKEKLEGNKRLAVIGAVCGVQIFLLFMFKLHFFRKS